MYGLGHRPDPVDVAARRRGFHILKAKRGLGVAQLPTSTFNRQFLSLANGGPGILNQGQTSSCEGHAHASGITLRFAIQQRPIDLVSPVCIYDVARMISRVPLADGTLSPLADEGTEPGLVTSGLAEWGASSAAAWGNYPADPATINDEPTPQQLMTAGDFRLAGAYFLQSRGDQYLRDLMTALAAGFPVSNAIAGGGALQTYTGGVLGPLEDNVDHATLWVDYEGFDGSDFSKVVFYGVNSWGYGFGESGLYRFNAAFASKYSSATCVLDVAPITGVL